MRPLVAIDGGAYKPKNSRSISSNILTIPKANSLYINESGDKMKGILDMGNNKITNIAEPTETGDVPNKLYVDNAINEERQSINRGLFDKTGLVRADKLPPVAPTTAFRYEYNLNIGNSPTVSYKLSKFQIPLLFDRTTNFDYTPKYPKLTSRMINFQITPFLNSTAYHDELFMNIQKYDITYNGLDLYILTFRSSNVGWGLDVQAHLTLTINFDGVVVLNST